MNLKESAIKELDRRFLAYTKSTKADQLSVSFRDEKLGKCVYWINFDTGYNKVVAYYAMINGVYVINNEKYACISGEEVVTTFLRLLEKRGVSNYPDQQMTHPKEIRYKPASRAQFCVERVFKDCQLNYGVNYKHGMFRVRYSMSGVSLEIASHKHGLVVRYKNKRTGQNNNCMVEAKDFGIRYYGRVLEPEKLEYVLKETIKRMIEAL